ncbi:MAG: hypothetical protein AB9907_08025 [Flexilinea sp.]
MIDNEKDKTLFSDAIKKGFYEVLGGEESVKYRILLNRSDLIGRGAEEIMFMKQFLSEKFGTKESEGLAFSIGKNSYLFIKSLFEKTLNFQDMDFRFLPTQRRIENALEELKSVVFCPLGIKMDCYEQNEAFIWKLDTGCPIEKSPAYLISGILQEMLTDISGGRFFPISVNPCDETEKTEIVIAKRALGH